MAQNRNSLRSFSFHRLRPLLHLQHRHSLSFSLFLSLPLGLHRHTNPPAYRTNNLPTQTPLSRDRIVFFTAGPWFDIFHIASKLQSKKHLRPPFNSTIMEQNTTELGSSAAEPPVYRRAQFGNRRRELTPPGTIDPPPFRPAQFGNRERAPSPVLSPESDGGPSTWAIPIMPRRHVSTAACQACRRRKSKVSAEP